MLHYAKFTISNELKKRIDFIQARLADDSLPALGYNIIFSNSLLHHLKNAQILWASIIQYGQKGTQVFFMVLLRPSSLAEAKSMVYKYVAEELNYCKEIFIILCWLPLDDCRKRI